MYYGAGMVSEKPWRTEAMIQLLLGIFACMSFGILMVSFLVPGGAQAEGQWKMVALLINAVSLHGGALVMIHYFVRQHGVKWGEVFGFRSPGKLMVPVLALLAVCAVLPVTWFLMHLSGVVMTSLQTQPESQMSVQVLQSTKVPGERLYFGVVAIVLAPVVEETLFRGILYPYIKQAGYPHLALWVCSLAFGMIHFNVLTFASLTMLAIVFTALYEQTNNLLAPILAHAFFNGVNFLNIVFQKEISDFFQRHAS
jgi:membrane protease YdiL (CAAX protease family)